MSCPAKSKKPKSSTMFSLLKNPKFFYGSNSSEQRLRNSVGRPRPSSSSTNFAMQQHLEDPTDTEKRVRNFDSSHSNKTTKFTTNRLCTKPVPCQTQQERISAVLQSEAPVGIHNPSCRLLLAVQTKLFRWQSCYQNPHWNSNGTTSQRMAERSS